MKNAPLITHMVVAITVTTTFLFQMAKLIAYINTYGEDRDTEGKDIHTEHYQERGGGMGHVCGKLEG